MKLQVDAENSAAWYAIDVADFEQVAAPVAAPAGAISVTAAPYNADPTGVVDATRPSRMPLMTVHLRVKPSIFHKATTWLPAISSSTMSR